MSNFIVREQSFVGPRKLLKSRPSRENASPGRQTRSGSPREECLSLAGDSGSPLLQKLGIKPGMAVTLIHPPAGYLKMLGPLPEGTRLLNRIARGSSFAQLFTTDRNELRKYLIQFRAALAETGMVWISWPKKSAGVPTTVTEDVIRALALPLGFVDTKVCAVDATWSGLKLMIRRENRKRAAQK